LPAISIYPNPAHTYCTIEGAAEIVGSTLQLMDLTGREVSSCKVTSSLYTFSTTALPAGLYLVRMTNLTGESIVKKLVIE